MLLAIDVGNTHTVVGMWNGSQWTAVWRKATAVEETEDQWAAWLSELCQIQGLPFAAHEAIIASVVPQSNFALRLLCERWFQCDPVFLTAASPIGLQNLYEPAASVGADRLANALGALELVRPPVVVVDFGTATTFDAINGDGAYLGGAILPGVEVSMSALVGHTAKLPSIELRKPDRAIGRNTTESLQSGIVLGYAGAIDALAEKVRWELGGSASVLATGGLGKLFAGLCSTIERYEPNLTLDGLVKAHSILTATIA